MVISYPAFSNNAFMVAIRLIALQQLGAAIWSYAPFLCDVSILANVSIEFVGECNVQEHELGSLP